jgi:serine/threonine protein kinase
MSSRIERLHIGPYRLVRQLQAGPLAERWLAFHEGDQTAHVAYRFRLVPDRAEQRRFVAAVEAMSALNHPHLLPVEQFTLAAGGGAWVVAPYTGNHEGLVTLSSLRQDKGGRLIPPETERALAQLLEGIEEAHNAGHQHGPIEAEEILVDRRGSLLIELYGLRRRLEMGMTRPASEIARDEVRSVVGIGYSLLTGLPADEPRIRASRLVPRLDHRWDEWFDEGLDPMGGFLTAGEAAAGLPGVRREVEGRVSPVRVVFGRMARALRAS